MPANNQGMGNGNYVVATHVIQYDEPAYSMDAEVYDVLSPSSRGYYSRFNPACQSPKIVLRNTGSTELTSAKIRYEVSGGLPKTYTWEGELGFLETEEVELPFQDGAFYLGDGTNRFTATIVEVNGGADQYAANNAFTSRYELPPIYEGDIIIQLSTNNVPAQNELKIYDAAGNEVFERDNMTANTLYRDTLRLDTGCYRLELTDSGHDGLSYWANPNQGNGLLRIWRGTGNGILQSFEPEFGNKLDFAFAIDAMTIDTIWSEVNGFPVAIIGGDTFEVNGDDLYPLSVEKTEDFNLNVYPNPNNGSFYVEMIGYTGKVEIEIMDLSGKRVYQETTGSMQGMAKSFDLNLTSGIYLLKLNGPQLNETRRVVIH